ncbi:MAG: 3-isopropylmalate dehydrogenase, partial [Lentisphaerales bacterium]
MSKTHKIAIIPGDGTGPEVIAEGIKVVKAAGQKYGFGIEPVSYDFGGDRYISKNEILPDSAVEELKKFDAIYLGAIGHPEVKPGILEKGILLKLRFALDQYINLRPVKLYPGVATPLKDKGPKEIDYVVIRENSGGLYTGIGGISMKGTKDEVAVQSMVYNYAQVERCLRYAFEYARKRNRRKTLALCGKTNVLTYVYDLWERTFHAIGEADFSDVKREYYHVDATCMWMIKNPEWFDVIVTGNMFGDIITDLGAITQGGMGIAAGANINPNGVSMFEPIGGSAPKYTGQNVINPLACICAGMMMLETLGETAAAEKI